MNIFQIDFCLKSNLYCYKYFYDYGRIRNFNFPSLCLLYNCCPEKKKKKQTIFKYLYGSFSRIFVRVVKYFFSRVLGILVLSIS